MQVLKPDTPDTPYLVQTNWQDKAVSEGWVGSEDFKITHSNRMPKEAFNGEGRIVRFEVLIAAQAWRHKPYCSCRVCDNENPPHFIIIPKENSKISPRVELEQTLLNP